MRPPRRPRLLEGLLVTVLYLSVGSIGTFGQGESEAKGGRSIPSAGGQTPGVHARTKEEQIRSARQSVAEAKGKRLAPVKARKLAKAQYAEALRILAAEAMQLDQLETEMLTHPYHRSRPHPNLKYLAPPMAPQALKDMTASFTGDPYRDTYIRWHLMWVVKKAAPADRRRFGEALLHVLQNTPDGLRMKMQLEYHHEPKDVYKQYLAARDQARAGAQYWIVEGYPPFQRRIGPPASFAKMEPDRRAYSEAAWAREQEVNKQFKERYKRVSHPWAIKRNARIRQVNHIIRQFRGELIYALLQTGDPEMLRVVLVEIDKRARGKRQTAFDLMSYLYLAAFDGVLGNYPQTVLNEAASNLEKTARASSQWVKYGNRSRNFEDYAFHMIYMLRDGGGFFTPLEAETTRRRGRYGR